MAASQVELSRLENVTQDLMTQRAQLQETVALLNERNSHLEICLKDAESREEQLKEEIKIVGTKVLTLEETATGSENKVG
jgi:chromosome segregation ATPase